MAFKRTSCKSLTNRNQARFSNDYTLKKVAKFDVGKEVYAIILGLEAGFYETPCHAVKPHKVKDKTIGFKNSIYTVQIKCKGVDEEGNRNESLCCQLAQLEKERIPDKDLSAKRIISFTNYRVDLPILVLGNSLGEDGKDKNYPVSKVSILNDLRSESGLKFAYIEMASSSFRKDVLGAYGTKLKEDGILEYDMDENSDEFLTEVCKRLSNTVVKIKGVSKTGFSGALKEYSFFPFDNPSIASGSPEGEREAIIGYKDNQDIQNKICDFLDLFNAEVDGLYADWTEKELQEYYNSAIGVDLKTNVETLSASTVKEEVSTPTPSKKEDTPEKIEVIKEPEKIEEVEVQEEESEIKLNSPVSDKELEAMLNPPEETEKDEALEEFSFDSDGEDAFFTEEE